MSDAKAMALLRQYRDAYLKDMDSEAIRFISAGQPIPDDLAKYLQELRDIPQTVTPKLNAEGGLDETTFTWPVPPIWWWNKKGFDSRSEDAAGNI